MARRLYEVKISTSTLVFADSQEEAEAFAQEALENVEFENVSCPGELHSFVADAADAIDEIENADDAELETK